MNVPAPSRQRAFSLVEMLAVIGILAFLAVLAVPAFNTIRGSRDLAAAGQDIAGTLEQARAYAMANRTYVWVGFQQKQAADPLLIGVVASKAGASDPGAEVLQLGKLMRLENVRLLALPLAEGESNVTSLASENTPIFSFTLSPGGQKQDFNTHVIQWNSRGEARVSSGAVSRIIEIGLKAKAGAAVRNEADYVAVRVSGLTGAVTLRQP